MTVALRSVSLTTLSHVTGEGRAMAARKILTLLGAVALAATPFATPAAAGVELVADPASYVDPLIGSTNAGNTYPGATTPFGMIAWSPTTTKGLQNGTGAAGGYQYDVTRVRGFSLTHLNGTGCTPGASGDVPIMPFPGAVLSSPSADRADQVFASDFSHADETAEPGHYGVGLANGVGVDLTTTDRAGLGRFTFPADKPANLLFRTSNSLPGSSNASISIDAAHRRVTGSVDSGGFCGRTTGGEENQRSYYTLHFSVTFDQPITGQGTWVDGTLRPGTSSATGGEGFTDAARVGKGSGGYVGFDASKGPVTARIGISYVSAANAQRNADAEIPAGRTFDGVRASARKAWQDQLTKIELGGGTHAQLTTFYTALYHALQQPSLASDVTGEYLGSDRKVHRLAKGQHAQYGTFSGWDVYRGQVQLLAFLDPARAGDYAQSLYNFAGQNGGEWDRWLHDNGGTHVMSGDPSAPALAGMYAFGARGFDVQGAFGSLTRAATVPTANDTRDAGCPIQCVGQRPGLADYLKLHYAPDDACHCWGSAAETLEDSVADFALSDWASRIGSDPSTFLARSGYWRNLVNPRASADGPYVQARKADGSWVTPFQPSTDTGFVEGSSAQYTWMASHDVAGMVGGLGGAPATVKRLDGFFHDAAGNWALSGVDDVHYNPGNEPDINAPWLYDYLGRPWQTQQTVRQIVNTVYGPGTGGLPGNDDLGTMSAWYVFATLGMFPQVPSRADLVLASPLFPRAVVHRGNGATITVEAPRASADTYYVQGVRVNGSPSAKPWVSESFVANGGTITYDLSTTPNPTWGTASADAPPQAALPAFHPNVAAPAVTPKATRSLVTPAG
ncbi:GH92 family glycosyl hydrolase [Amycolatopsis sp. NBC_00348]|uniref:GH92 family glycosyl hydrolase n=1 Tax=Amycolatopsis sp. NBC_00348 TaxID=2975956 RepID=UPI002E264FCD